MPTVRLHIFGTVQGVCYRATCKEIAEGLGLAGHIQNEPDGSVSLLATGKKTYLDTLIVWCKKGPPQATVTSLTAEWHTDEPAYHGFGIR